MKAKITVLIDTEGDLTSQPALEIFCDDQSASPMDSEAADKIAELIGALLDKFIASWMGTQTTGFILDSDLTPGKLQ